MSKKIFAVVLSLLMVLSFAACKDKEEDGSTTDYDFEDIFDESSLSDEEVESLWQEALGGAETGTSTGDNSSSEEQGSDNSSSNTSSDDSSDDDEVAVGVGSRPSDFF